MRLDELRRILRQTDPAAIVIAPRLFRRIMHAEFKVPYLRIGAPHERCFVVAREVLFRHVEQYELDLEPERMLPPTVILIAKPTTETLQALTQQEALLKYWRALFHAKVHAVLESRVQNGQLDAAAVRQRVDLLGPTVFEEIRQVLSGEDTLVSAHDDVQVYIEFVAQYLELRHFRPNLRASYFPALRDYGLVDGLIARDVDGEAIFAATRLPEAADPVVRTDTSSDESNDYFLRLLAQAKRCLKEGNVVRAAILQTKAARVAPAAQTKKTRAEALLSLEVLTKRLRAALQLSDEAVQDWLRVLPALLEKADQGTATVEGNLLFDLQAACIEHERKVFQVDFVEWVATLGKRPIRRPLDSLQMVHITKHLRAATQRLTGARISDEDRQGLARLLRSALQGNEAALRARFRPVLHDAFLDVGLRPATLPEEVALAKIIEELLDRIAENGFLSFTDLRDILSRNQLKLPDFRDPHAFWRGDPLLQLDRRLGSLMDGVYHRGEIYLRLLERGSALLFGTRTGRFAMRNLIAPFGGAYLTLGLADLIQEKVVHKCFDVDVSITYLAWLPFLALGVFLLALIHIEPLRHGVARGFTWLGWAIRTVSWDWPVRVWRLPLVQAMVNSWPILLLYWFLLKPLLACGLIWLLWPGSFHAPWFAALTVAGMSWVLNSRAGYAISEAMIEAFVLAYGWLRYDVLVGLYRWIVAFFGQISKTIEIVLYSVAEWLRFRSDEGTVAVLWRAVLSVLWFPVGYLTRLFFLLLIEPTVNPIKFPLTTLAAKVIYPFYYNPQATIHEQAKTLVDQLAPHIGEISAWTFVVAVVVPFLFLFPAVFAFLVWEMKGNWRLFRANRPRQLRPVVLGPHGERMRELLVPGFHSGTIPHLYAKLREAERVAYRTDNWRAARAYRQALQELERSVRVFVARELISLLHRCPEWRDHPLSVGHVELANNEVAVSLLHARFPNLEVTLAFEVRAPWIVGQLRSTGWLRQLEPAARRDFAAALGGLYKLAGVQLVMEQLRGALPASCRRFDLTIAGLVAWGDGSPPSSARYDLRRLTHASDLEPAVTTEPDHWPALVGQQAIFELNSLTWEAWEWCWNSAQHSKRPQPFANFVHLLPADLEPFTPTVAAPGWNGHVASRPAMAEVRLDSLVP